MDITSFLRRNILAPGPASKVQTELEASTALRDHVDVRASATSVERRESSAARYGLTDGDLRSVVERGFMRMNEAHDRIRREVLASRWQT